MESQHRTPVCLIVVLPLPVGSAQSAGCRQISRNEPPGGGYLVILAR